MTTMGNLFLYEVLYGLIVRARRLIPKWLI